MAFKGLSYVDKVGNQHNVGKNLVQLYARGAHVYAGVALQDRGQTHTIEFSANEVDQAGDPTCEAFVERFTRDALADVTLLERVPVDLFTMMDEYLVDVTRAGVTPPTYKDVFRKRYRAIQKEKLDSTHTKRASLELLDQIKAELDIIDGAFARERFREEINDTFDKLFDGDPVADVPGGKGSPEA